MISESLSYSVPRPMREMKVNVRVRATLAADAELACETADRAERKMARRSSTLHVASGGIERISMVSSQTTGRGDLWAFMTYLYCTVDANLTLYESHYILAHMPPAMTLVSRPAADK